MFKTWLWFGVNGAVILFSSKRLVSLEKVGVKQLAVFYKIRELWSSQRTSNHFFVYFETSACSNKKKQQQRDKDGCLDTSRQITYLSHFNILVF